MIVIYGNAAPTVLHVFLPSLLSVRNKSINKADIYVGIQFTIKKINVNLDVACVVFRRVAGSRDNNVTRAAASKKVQGKHLKSNNEVSVVCEACWKWFCCAAAAVLQRD